MKVADILKSKGSGVNTISSHSPLREALKIMIENKVGSLVVINPEFNPIGIITERDIIRIVYQKDRGDWQGLAVNEVMTKDIIIGVPDMLVNIRKNKMDKARKERKQTNQKRLTEENRSKQKQSKSPICA